MVDRLFFPEAINLHHWGLAIVDVVIVVVVVDVVHVFAVDVVVVVVAVTPEVATAV